MAAAVAIWPRAPPPARLHITINQHAAQQVYVIKTKECFCCYYLSAM
jgi:hypothetical protein